MSISKLTSAFTNITHIQKSLEIWEEDKIFIPVFIQYHTEPPDLHWGFPSGVSMNAGMLQPKELLVESGNPSIYRVLDLQGP